MSSPLVNSPGTAAQGRGEPFGAILPPVHELPGLPGGVHAPGPFGQVESAPAPRRHAWPRMPASGLFRFQRIGLNGGAAGPVDNLVSVDRPTLGRLVNQGATLSTAVLVRFWVSPWPGGPVTPGFGGPDWGLTASREVFLFPGPGDWCLRAENFGSVADTATIALLDATNEGILAYLFPGRQANTVVQQANIVLGAGDNVIFSTSTMAFTRAIDIVNPNAAAVRLQFAFAANATTGHQLTAVGTFGDRVRWDTGQIPLAELHAFSAAGGNLTAIRYI